MRAPKREQDPLNPAAAPHGDCWGAGWWEVGGQCKKQPFATPATPDGEQENRIWPQMAEVHRKEIISVSPEAYIFYIVH